MSWNQYPGGGHQQQGGYGYQPPQQQQWQNNPPPPMGAQGYGRPPPPPMQMQGGYHNNPPPPQQYSAPSGGYSSGGGYQQQHSQPHQGNYRLSGGYVPPTNAPVESSYHQTGAGYMPPSQPQGQFAPYGNQGMPARPPTQSQHYGPQFQGQGGQQAQPYFQYSQCTGKKKALCIGINYIGTSSALAGCINDAHNVQKFLIQRYGYKSEDIVMLTDDARNTRQIPTRANMIAAMRWLVSGASPNDSLFFHYSGHGGQTEDLDGDEDDGHDETIYPLDFKQSGHIVDDEMHDIMVKPLPAGCRLTAIFDSCHSGTALDLPYVYSTEGVIKEPNLLAEAGSGLLSAGMSYLRGDTGGMLSGIMGIGKKVYNNNSGAAERTKQSKTSPADVVMWSGCKDSQTSADTQEAGRATGAMSYAFIAALTKYQQQSYVQLLNTIRDELKGKYDQKPQLSASHPMDTNLLFIC
ncbi:metacaspase-1 [Cryptococcus wingfieldii CBS 7118]|uniref:Metacaspase-1 n=1 Tax=Cryptococcus wingfieldii CBS 7118 TaxID=1295528 RepID=A0A1E3K796_9TREE|nr:metacaspase-1 [Cryptococcus wingfieldii CBS 7118]ODO08733.1 metacaspase-1 [Cryptococcus wingfieldii CBS 7118]